MVADGRSVLNQNYQTELYYIMGLRTVAAPKTALLSRHVTVKIFH